MLSYKSNISEEFHINVKKALVRFWGQRSSYFTRMFIYSSVNKISEEDLKGRRRRSRIRNEKVQDKEF